MIECVVNISEGRDHDLLAELDDAAGDALLDRHSDPDHHRSVFTLVGEDAPRSLAALAVERLHLDRHRGAHPRIGVVDVVPFVPLGHGTQSDALRARDAYASWSASSLGVPCFLYGPERTLPEVRRGAFHSLAPDHGTLRPHPTAGATAVGQRDVMVAYNVELADPDLELAREVARAVRSTAVRALGLSVGDRVQVSMNLIAPHEVGPDRAFDAVAALAPIARAELVGLMPAVVLDAVPAHRWSALDLAEDRTIEARLEARGWTPA